MIKLENIGPIASAAIKVPEDGGVVVLRGRNGSGKSIALDAVSAAVSGKGKPPLKDLAKRGEVQAGGVSLTVGRNVRRTGELEVATLEGRLSVADLVDPGIVDPARADATRIKALVGLSGATIDPGDLHGFPDELLDGLNVDDPVAAMAELKRRLDIGAREYEKLSEKDAASARALLESNPEPDEPLIDKTAAQERVTAALRALDAVQAQDEAATDAAARAAAARERLSALPVADVVAAKDSALKAEAAVQESRALAQRLKAEYEAALSAYKGNVATRDLAFAASKAAEEQAAMRAELERQIDESAIPGPTPEEIEAAERELEKARADIAQAHLQALNAERRKDGEALAVSAQEYAAEATELRRKAKQTDEVLSEIVSTLPGCPLQVIDGRLLCSTKRGPTHYHELSMGERWRIALDIAIQAVCEGGLLVIPQEAWEGLDPQNRKAIAQQAKAARVVILTAECSDGELTAEPA